MNNRPQNAIAADALLDAGWPALTLVMIVLVWATHALAFFSHEYSHSFTAWALGWKQNPWLLHFGSLDAGNLIAQIDIDENVDYAPIFAAGAGPQAALISGAGAVIGNGLLLIVLAPLTLRAIAARRRFAVLLLFLLCVMCVGNFIDYVPNRTFAPLDDMRTVETGFGISPWVLLLAPGIPFLAGGWFLFARLLPDARSAVFPDRLKAQRMLTLVSAFLVFVFYGAAGLETGMGAISKGLAYASIGFLFPLVAILCWPRRTS